MAVLEAMRESQWADFSRSGHEQNFKGCSRRLAVGDWNGGRAGPAQSSWGSRPGAGKATRKSSATAKPGAPAARSTARSSSEAQATELGASSAPSLSEPGPLATEHARSGIPLSTGIWLSPLGEWRCATVGFPIQRVLLRQLCSSRTGPAAPWLPLGALRTGLAVGERRNGTDRGCRGRGVLLGAGRHLRPCLA